VSELGPPAEHDSPDTRRPARARVPGIASATRVVRLLALPAAILMAITGCGAAATPLTPASVGGLCEQSFIDAAAIPPNAASDTDLDQAIRSCATIAQWMRYSQVHPGGLHEADALAFLGDRCSDPAAGLERYAMCMGLGIALATPSPTPEPTPTPRPTRKPRPTPRPTPYRTPRPTPRPTPVPLPRVPSITGSFFGPGVKVTWYRIAGDTPMALGASIQRHGPYHRWLGHRAEALTESSIQSRFSMQPDGYGGCKIVYGARPAIKMTFTIVLPRWKPLKTADPSTVRWWIDELLRAARHERMHVRIYIAATRKANKVLASSTCATEQRRLNAVWRQAQRDNCQFDMDEYGKASGLTMKACMAQ
jgi:predicted secreted Zn-dependent protease